MSRITLDWADYFREIFVNQIEALTKCLEKRILSTFDAIEDLPTRISVKDGLLMALESVF